MIKKRILILLFFIFIFNKNSYCEQKIESEKVITPPVIDGIANDEAWNNAKEITTYDKIAKLDVVIKSVYTDKEVFFIVTYPDLDKSISHKSWVWLKGLDVYKLGPDREDIFIFKWNMIGDTTLDLSLSADEPYFADVWFWKASRTDPVGFADDKYDRLSATELPESMKTISKKGYVRYLQRPGDDGAASYTNLWYSEFAGEKLPHFSTRAPKGSRADVKAKGIWENNKWTIEFARALNTNNKDDAQFDISKSYQFGVSRYEISARSAELESEQPFYNLGDISEDIFLVFKPEPEKEKGNE